MLQNYSYHIIRRPYSLTSILLFWKYFFFARSYRWVACTWRGCVWETGAPWFLFSRGIFILDRLNIAWIEIPIGLEHQCLLSFLSCCFFAQGEHVEGGRDGEITSNSFLEWDVFGIEQIFSVTMPLHHTCGYQLAVQGATWVMKNIPLLYWKNIWGIWVIGMLGCDGFAFPDEKLPLVVCNIWCTFKFD